MAFEGTRRIDDLSALAGEQLGAGAARAQIALLRQVVTSLIRVAVAGREMGAVFRYPLGRQPVENAEDAT
jgi:hypothetical protein